MRGLVLGISGMAGHTIAMYFMEQGVEVEGFDQTKVDFCKSYVGNALDFKNLEKLISAGNYDFVVNAIGILNQSAENNKPKAVLLNSYLPHFLVDVTKNIKTKIIHMSTDCVFSGMNSPYEEDSVPDGLTFYDRTKALGEINNTKDLTFRNSIIGPDKNKNGIGLFNWFTSQKGQIKGYNQSIWTGVSTLTLAEAMYVGITENLTGIYNLVNNSSITKYEMLQLFKRYTTKNNVEILKFDNELLDKTLLNRRIDFSFVVPSYDNMIYEMIEWAKLHKDMYPHYKLWMEE